jgi:hypothetical protein
MKKRRVILLIIIIVLFLAPLRWFPKDSLDVGGDDSRLFFLAPENFVNNLSLYCWNSYNALSSEYTPWYGFPFVLIPLLLKKIGLPVGLRYMVFYGMTLSLSFLSCYLFIKEMLLRLDLTEANRWLSSVLGSLIYLFSPIVFMVDWQTRLPEIYGLFLYPLLVYFFMLALRKRKPIFLIFGAMALSIFSVAMYMAVPWFLGFMIGALPIIIGVILVQADRRVALKYLIIYVGLCSLLNMHWILILIDNTFLSKVALVTYGGSFAAGSIYEFAHNIQFMNVYYSFLMLPAREYYSGTIFGDFVPYCNSLLFLILPLTFITALIKSNREARKLLLWLMAPVIILFYLITVSITDLGSAFFATLLNNVFGFVMFKNFQTKFSIGFSFFYAVLIAASLAVILRSSFSNILKKGFIIILILPFLMPAIPLLRGDLVGTSPGKLFHEDTCVSLPENHLEALEVIKKDEDVSRVLIFPLARYLFMTTKCDNNSYYIGLPYIKPLILKDCIEGFSSFTTPNYPDLPNVAYKIYDNKDYDVFLRLLGMMNIKYVYSYNEVAPETAQMFLYKYSYLDKMRSDFYKELDNYSLEEFNDIELFKKNDFKDVHINGHSSAVKVDRVEWLLPILYKDDYLNLENSVILDIR